VLVEHALEFLLKEGEVRLVRCHEIPQAAQ
jgi:hypothetical protein